MDYPEVQRWLDRVAPAVTRDKAITAQLAWLKERSAEGELTRDAAAAWYALVGELRRVADAHERDLIRKLRTDGLTWAQVADAVQAQLSSRQAAQAKWKRLIDPTRRTTNGNMRRGGRPRTAVVGDPSPPGEAACPPGQVSAPSRVDDGG